MTCGYEEHRDGENLRLLEKAIDDFSDRYRDPPLSSSNSPRRTVFFFPGGMTSRLTCAKTKFDPSNPQEYEYDTIWVTPRTFVWLDIRDFPSFEALEEQKLLPQTFNLAGIATRFLADMMRGV